MGIVEMPLAQYEGMRDKIEKLESENKKLKDSSNRLVINRTVYVTYPTSVRSRLPVYDIMGDDEIKEMIESDFKYAREENKTLITEVDQLRRENKKLKNKKWYDFLKRA